MRAFLLLILAVLALARPAQAQPLLHFYELGVEVNGSRLSLAISDALTGESLWGGIVGETGGTPDVQFDTNGQGGPGIIPLPPGLLVLSFSPTSCAGDTGAPIPGCVPLGTSIKYAWAGDPNPLTVGSFYRPTAGNGKIDTDFYLSNGSLSVHTNDSGIVGNINTYLGQTGWTLPYDRVALCALTTCSGNGPEGQFFSAGVQTQAALPPYDGERLVPTFSFKGDVTPPTAWGTLTWNVPSLRLQFLSSKKLTLNAPLNATGTLFTSTGASAGWGGVQYNSGSGGTLSGVTVERVTGYGQYAVSITNASPTISNSTIQRNSSLSSAVTGLRVTGSSAAPTVDKTIIKDMTSGGVVVDSQADLRMTDSFVTTNAGTGISAGYLSETFLYPAIDRPEASRDRGTQVTGNTGTGITATSSASVVMGIYYYSYDGHHTNGFNSAVNNGGRGIAASGGSTIYAGGTTNWQRNRFFDNVGNDAESAGSGTSVPVRCDWWNDTTPPFRTATSGGATLDASYWLLQDPYVNPTATCTAGDILDGFGRAGVAARGTGASDGDGLADRLSDALDLPPAEAVAALVALTRAAPESPEAGAAVTQIARLAGAEDAPDDARAFVETTAAAAGPMQTAARQALVGLRHRAGDVDGALAVADALAAGEGNAALTGHVARVYLLHGAGRDGEAREALATVDALAPRGVEAWLARLALGLEVDGPPVEGGVRPREAGLTAAKHDAGAFAVGGVTPNPAAGRAEVAVTLAAPSVVRVAVYDVLGREVAVVLDGPMEAGTHRAALDVNRLAPGAYLVRVTAGGAVETRRLTVAR